MRVTIALASVGLLLAGCSAFAGPAHRHATPGRVAFVARGSGSAVANVVEVSPRGGRVRAVTGGTPSVVEAAWSADGRELVFARRFENPGTLNTQGSIGIYVVRDGATPDLIRRCAITCDASSFAWSPDGRRIAFAAAGEIAVMNADGSGFRVVCDEARCGQGLDDPRWSPDGSSLLFSDMGEIGVIGIGIPPSRVWVSGADGADPHPVTQPHCRPGHPPLAGCAYDSAAAWSPDGHWIAFSRLYQEPQPGKHTRPRTVIELMRPDGSDLHPLAACTGLLCNQIMPPVWAPDGSRIAYAPNVEHGPQVVIITPGGRRSIVRTCTAAACATPDSLAWSPDGRALAFASGTKLQTAYVISAGGGGMHAVGRAIACCLAWLPGR